MDAVTKSHSICSFCDDCSNKSINSMSINVAVESPQTFSITSSSFFYTFCLSFTTVEPTSFNITFVFCLMAAKDLSVDISTENPLSFLTTWNCFGETSFYFFSISFVYTISPYPSSTNKHTQEIFTWTIISSSACVLFSLCVCEIEI